MDKPFFTVVIPTYNHEFFLKKAVNSVLNQTFDDYEIIIIDNYSDDKTEEYIKSLNNQKIRFFKIQNHGLLAKSRNLGIKEAKSDWIAFLDSDDLWYKDRLQILYNYVEKNNDYQVVSTNELIVDKFSKKNKVWKYGPFRGNFYKNLLVFGNCISTSASIVKRKYLEDNEILFSENRDFCPYEDYDFWMRVAKKKAKFKFLNAVKGEHLFHKDSWGAKNRDLCKKSNISILKHHVFNSQNFTNKKDELWSKVDARVISDEIREMVYNRKYTKAFFKFIKLLCKYPFKSMNYFFLSAIRSIK